VKHRVDQFSAMDKHQRTGIGDGLASAGSFSLNTAVHLTSHSGLHIPTTATTALAQGIGTGSDGLGPKGGQGPMVGHFTTHNARERCLDAERVHNPDTPTTTTDLKFAPITTGAKPDSAWIVIVHR
jgi:hypothetical protein